jgi:hypothetical protein
VAKNYQEANGMKSRFADLRIETINADFHKSWPRRPAGESVGDFGSFTQGSPSQTRANLGCMPQSLWDSFARRCAWWELRAFTCVNNS